MKKTWFISLIIFFTCLKVINAQDSDTLEIRFAPFTGYDYDLSKVNIINDTFTFNFDLYAKIDGEERRGLYLQENEITSIKVEEDPQRLPLDTIPYGFIKLNQSDTAGAIPDDIIISLLVDHSGTIDDSEMARIKEAMLTFVEQVPEGCLYFSSFSSDISESVLLTKESFDQVTTRRSAGHTALYNAIYTKLLEFIPGSEIPNIGLEPIYNRNEELSKRNSKNNYLIVLTDGVNDVTSIPRYMDPETEKIWFPELINALKKHQNKVKVFSLGFGENSDDFDERDLRLICAASGNPNGYSLVKPDNILDRFVQLTDEFSTEDYAVMFKKAPGAEYAGEPRSVMVTINTNNPHYPVAQGECDFSIGTPASPVYVLETPESEIWTDIIFSIIIGVVLWLVIIIIMQLMIPLFKNRVFNMKYVKKYKPANNELQRECPYCGDPLNPGDKVVMKCEHVVHKVCWNDFDHVCPEFGQNCTTGKQDFFDISDPFSKKNRKYYIKWVSYGLIGGFLAWLIYMLIRDTGLMHKLVKEITLSISPSVSATVLGNFVGKLSSFLIIGTLLGFFLTFLFAYIEDYRRKNFSVIIRVFVRSIIGAILGFVSFLLGGIILILLNVHTNDILLDWIPWIIFGGIIGLSLSVRTTIVWKHGLFGGMISIIFGFLILIGMALSDYETLALMVSLMLFGGGLGFSIATVHSRAENYYLKIVEGKKNVETIPIHKWMSYQGGHNEVYIGRSFSCEIQMNWESQNDEIAEKHAKLYINRSNMPVIVSLDSSKKTNYNHRFDMNTSKEYELYSGASFKIGNTLFEYYEKDK